MPKYFMSGTKHEAYERMMMSPSRRVQEPNTPEKDKSSRKKRNTKERSAEKNAVSCDPQ